MLAPFVTYLLKIDRATWTAFKDRLDAEGRTVKYVLEELIRQYIQRGLDRQSRKKDGRK